MKVLIVEDERDISELMLLHLRREGLDVTVAEDGEEALGMLKASSFGLVVLDWMLPGVSGLEICKSIRGRPESKTTPVLMVTARADTADIVLGLEMGADDYVTKPFEVPVFLARARALLRRAKAGSGEAGAGARIRLGELEIDTAAHRVSCGSEELKLTPSEFKLLHALASNPGRVLTRERLIDLVQGEGIAVIDRAIDTHVFGLRKKLGQCADCVETIRGVGYRIKSD